MRYVLGLFGEYLLLHDRRELGRRVSEGNDIECTYL